jgi:hypothetical protein
MLILIFTPRHDLFSLLAADSTRHIFAAAFMLYCADAIAAFADLFGFATRHFDISSPAPAFADAIFLSSIRRHFDDIAMSLRHCHYFFHHFIRFSLPFAFTPLLRCRCYIIRLCRCQRCSIAG